MRIIPLLIASIFSYTSFSQVKSASTKLQRPKLVVGIAVDQMRWDYLYRYYDRYGNDGFKRLLDGGFSCENTMINYLPSVTAVGHTIAFTGSVPAITGITGNDWVDQLSGKTVYCTSDTSVQGVGGSSPVEGRMSPRNLLVTTITDELRMATNFQSKVVGVSLKDRASILPAGHSANAAFWFEDASGHFITSTYYMNQLPDWATRFNNSHIIDSLVANGWKTLYPINTYKQSDPDDVSYEGKFVGEQQSTFPHNIKEIYASNKSSLRNTPFGNTLTLEFAKAALDGYKLGRGEATDFLTINFASTDGVGHMFGINSIEIEDTYLRLDKDLANLFKTLDEKIGKNQWLVFLTADHGAANAVGYMKEHKLPADWSPASQITDSLNKRLSQLFQVNGLVRSISDNQVNFDLDKIYSSTLDFDVVKKATVDFLQRQPGISLAVDISNVGNSPVPQPLKAMIGNSYFFKRSGSVQIIPIPGQLEAYYRTGTGHSKWNPYDTHIPFILYGWKIKPGRLHRTVNISDIAPTVAALLHIQMGSGSVGQVVSEVIPAK
jgi:predicted AlkP superfamily pyrophosphatase or phosphodiesterase